MKILKPTQVKFYWLLMEVLAGRRPIEEIFEHDVFRSRGKRICQAVARVGSYEWEDVFQDVCLKVWRSGDTLCPDNIPNEAAFFSWLFVVARNCRFDKFRGKGKLRGGEESLSDISTEELRLVEMDTGSSPEEECRRQEFLESLPENRRRALILWYEGYSCEKIAEILTREGIPCSNVTARKWGRDALQAYCADDDHRAVRKSVRGYVKRA
jgi:RNA polymerase sigma factor (sigma-70 family)